MCLEIAPGTLDALVPHLLLQPLVDNAVKHGISKRPAAGEIKIAVTAQDGELQLEVRDNGPGPSKHVGSPSGGLGLRITRGRLESLYGQYQSVELLSAPGGGTLTRVCIPFRMQGPEDRPDSEEVYQIPAAARRSNWPSASALGKVKTRNKSRESLP